MIPAYTRRPPFTFMKLMLMFIFLSRMNMISAQCDDSKFQPGYIRAADSILNLGNKLRTSDPSGVERMISELEPQISNSRDTCRWLKLLLLKSKLNHYSMNNVSKAMEHIQLAKEIASKGYEKYLPAIYSLSGRIKHRGLGDLNGSLDDYLKGAEWEKRVGNPANLHFCYSDIADLYLSIPDLKMAENYIEKSLEILRKNKNPKDYGFALFNAKEIYTKSNNPAKLLEIENEYAQFTKSRSDSSKVVHAGTSFLTEKIDPIQYFKDKIERCKKLNDTTGTIVSLVHLADSSIHLKEYDLAILSLKEGLKYLTEDMNLWHYTFNTKLARAYKAQGNYKAALVHSENQLKYQSELIDQEKSLIIADLEARYDTKEKASEIELLTRDKAIASRNQWILGISVFALTLLAVFIFALYRNRQKNIRDLEHKNETISNMLRDKEFLIKEIHHRVKNNLQIVSSLLQLQSRYISDSNALEALNDGESRVKSMAIIHHHLYSDDNLSKVNIAQYINNLIENILVSYNLRNEKISIHQDVDDLALDVSIMIPIGLIINELITNAFKYAFIGRESGQVWISVKKQGVDLMISVKDDGVGKDIGSEKTGFGTRMVNAFLKKLDASIETKIQEGTSIFIAVPDYDKEIREKLSA